MNFANLKEWTTPRGSVVELAIDGKIAWKKDTEPKVGDSVFMNVDGVRTEFIIAHIGNPDTQIYDESCDGVWVIMKDVHSNAVRYDSGEPWKYNWTEMHDYLNGTFFSMLDASIQQLVKLVKIPYSDGDVYEETSGAAYGENGLLTRVFLPNETELSGFGLYHEGKLLDYFDYGYSGNEKRKAYKNGVAVSYPTRTLYFRYDEEEDSTTTEFSYVSKTGYMYATNDFTSKVYPRPMFILPQPLQVDGSNNVIA